MSYPNRFSHKWEETELPSWYLKISWQVANLWNSWIQNSASTACLKHHTSTFDWWPFLKHRRIQQHGLLLREEVGRSSETYFEFICLFVCFLLWIYLDVLYGPPILWQVKWPSEPEPSQTKENRKIKMLLSQSQKIFPFSLLLRKWNSFHSNSILIQEI